MWTAREVTWLKEVAGRMAVTQQARDLGRSLGSVRNKRWELGLTEPDKQPSTKYEATEALHEDLRQAYQGGSARRGELTRVATKHQVSKSFAQREARRLGLLCFRGDGGGRWTEEEVDILERTSHLSLEGAQRRLKKAGFHRSVAAIANRRWEERVSADQAGYYSATQAAQLLGIHKETLLGAIRRKEIKAKRYGQGHGPNQETHTWLIHERQLRRYVINNPTAPNPKRVDIPWLIDLLGNGGSANA